MEVRISKSYEELSQHAAEFVADLLNAKPNAVLGLATGSSPVGLYRELVRMHKDEGLDFSQVTTFNLDEYVGLPAQHEQSYHYFMYENLFKHINVPKERVHIPSGTTRNYRAFCQWYEDRIEECGGIDMQILGNRIINTLAGDDLAGCVDLVAACTGILAYNAIYMEDNTDILTAVDGGNLGRIENYCANEYGQEGAYSATQSA